jgi:hypothetical protein
MDHTFYKLDIQGIVYLIDPVTTKAYTYDLSNPTEIGTLVWNDPKAPPSIDLKPEWVSILTLKLEAQPALTNPS